MEKWIDRLLMGGGAVAGSLLGIGQVAEGLALAAIAIPAAWLIRTNAAKVSSAEHSNPAQ